MEHQTYEIYYDEEGDFLEKIVTLNLEAKKLSKIRDLLLPKLMSGEIRVR